MAYGCDHYFYAADDDPDALGPLTCDMCGAVMPGTDPDADDDDGYFDSDDDAAVLMLASARNPDLAFTASDFDF